MSRFARPELSFCIDLRKLVRPLDNGQDNGGEANRRAPVGKTGELSASYDHKEDLTKKSTTIGSPLNYAPYVELGTGPHYEKPPEWVKNYAQRGHHDTDPWWYMGDDGEWHLGWFIHAQPHLRPAVDENVDKIKKIVKDNLNNA